MSDDKKDEAVAPEEAAPAAEDTPAEAPAAEAAAKEAANTPAAAVEAVAKAPAAKAAPAATATIDLSKDAAKVLELVEKLPVLELAGLVKAMEEKFGVSAAAPVAVAAAGGGATGDDAGGDAAGGKKTVVLASAGGQKIAVIKVVREITGLGLKEAKDIVDAAPKPLKEGVEAKEAEELKKKLEEAGATVELQ